LAIEDRTRELVRGFISEWVDRGECDVIGDYAMRTSVRIACIVGGLPLDMADWFVKRVNSMFERDEGGRASSERAMMLVGELHAWLEAFVVEQRKNPTDEPNVMNALFHARPNGQPLSNKDVLANISLLLVGGTETLPKAFSACVYRLFQNPDQRAEIVKDPSLVTGAFREALRYDMPTQALGRRVKVQKEVHGQKLRLGQGVLFLWASANRDEREFADPDRFDIHRRAPRILTFGSGAHMCLGAHFAQMEGRVMLEELLAVAPEYEVLEDQAARIRSEVFRGFSSLPIRFNPPR
jgi:cytochrome P450